MKGQGVPSHLGSRAAAFALPLLFAVVALFALPSLAAADYGYRTRILAPNQVDSPQRVAVEQSTGNAFVVDETHGRVSVTRPTGLQAELLTTFGTGILQKPFGIAVDESGPQTRVYVSDAGLEEIVRFVSDGQSTPTFTVDATYTSPAQGGEAGQIESFASPLALAPNGDLWVADRGANLVKRFDPEGNHVAGSNFDGTGSPEGAFTGLLDIAANSEGDLYIVDTTGEIRKAEGESRVQRFSAGGEYKATIGPLGPRNRSGVLAVNPGNDSIIVSGDQDQIIFGDPTPHFYRFDAENNFLDEFTMDFTLIQGGGVRGIGIHAAERNPAYVAFGRTFNASGNEGAGLPGFHVASELFAPLATIDPPSGVTSNSATISGQIDARSIPTTWEVEYRRVGAAEWETAGSRSAGEGSVAVAVSEVLQGLLPAHEYEARIRARSADGTTLSGIETFATSAAAPRIAHQWATVGTDRATLRARVNPGGEETTYRFEWGTTDSYGEQTPDATIPAGTGGVNVSAHIEGLSPGQTYHFRVVAENATGEALGDDAVFTTLSGEPDACPNAEYRTGPAAHLGECRAYELVTPSSSRGDVRMTGGPSSVDGDIVCFNTEYRMLNSDPNGIKLADDGFCSRRGENGWETNWVTGPEPIKRLGSLGGNVYFLSPDGERVVFSSDEFIFRPDYLSPSAITGTTQMRSYMWEAGQTRELSPPPPPIVVPFDPPLEFFQPEQTAAHKRPLAVSEDLTRGVFQSTNQLVPEDMNFESDIYEWNPDGVRLVSTADGSSIAAGGTPPFEDSRQLMGQGVVSADGSRIFFHHKGAPLDQDAEPGEAPPALQSVYMREGDELTLVSPRSAANAGDNFRFAAASADGELVFVESTRPRDPTLPEFTHVGKDIYLYRVSTGKLELFASPPGGAQLLGISRDGSTVVYRTLGNFQVFVVRNGQTELLGTLAPSERGFIQNEPAETPFRLGSYRIDQRALRITPDGKALTFVSAGEFTGYTGGVAQVYRWSEDDGLQNISDVGETPPTEDASIGAYATAIAGNPREEFLAEHRFKTLEGRVISDDGSRIFFETAEALVDRDVNGTTDVYEWHDGKVDLVSTGTGRSQALYHESSADGKTVFFATFDRLDPERDRNSNRDVYVARPEGGLPPLPAQPSCAGEACQPGRDAPTADNPGSRSAGDGNVLPGPKLKALGRGKLRQLAKRGRATVAVVVSEPGRVTAQLKGRIKGRPATVARTSGKASAAGTVRLTLRLSKQARAQLRRTRTLRLTLEVRHSKSDQTARRRVVLRG